MKDGPGAQADFPPKLEFLFQPKRWKVAYGGRGGAKSWGVARALLILAAAKPLRILCAREFQSSLAESVHKLLENQIAALGLQSQYIIEKASIRSLAGSEFFFEGIARNTQKIKSYEAVDICWVEEASLVSHDSWMILEPTIRKADEGPFGKGSEIWVTFNPNLRSDATYKRFIESPPADAIVVKMSWRDNPWFPIEVLGTAMVKLKSESPDEYLHVYEGHTKTAMHGAVYGAELRQALLEQRVTMVPWERLGDVQTAWDLGRRDTMACWFIQELPTQIRVLDYYENSMKDLDHYFRVLAQRGYTYSCHWLPHDAKAKVLGRKYTIEEQFREHLGPAQVRVVPRQSLADGIAATRAMLAQCYFDERKTDRGLERLKGYHYEVDSDNNVLSNEPVHDGNSHGADAFRTFAQGRGGVGVGLADRVTAALRKATGLSPRTHIPIQVTPQSWMG